MIFDTGRGLDTGRHIHQIRSSDTNSITGIFRRETARETKAKTCRSVRQTLPCPGEAIAGAGIEKGETSPCEMRDAIPVHPGPDPDPPNHLPPEHFNKRVGFVTVKLNPVKPELSPHADDFLERCVEKDPNGLCAPHVADPAHLFR